MTRPFFVFLFLSTLLSQFAVAEITYLNSIRRAFLSPAGVDVSLDGTVFVADLGNQSVKRLDVEGNQLGSFFVSSPRDVGVSPAYILNNNGTSYQPVFVVDQNNDQIRRFNQTGAQSFNFGSTGTDAGEFQRPLGLGVNLIGDVFVADTENNRIQRFDINGVFQSAFGSAGSGVGEFDAPSDVAIGPLGEIFVADRNNNRVQKFDNDGNFEFAIGGFNDPTSVALSEAGQLYVADRDNHRIQRYGTDGALQETFGSQGNGDLQFNSPLGVAVSSSGMVYVADSSNNRVPRYFDSDAWVRGRNEFTNIATGPVSVGVGSPDLFVPENFNRVSLGNTYTLRPLMELVVGASTRIVADGLLTIDGGELDTNALLVEGLFAFRRGDLTIRSHGIQLGDGGPFGDELRVGLNSSVTLGDDMEVGVARNARLVVERGGVVTNVDGRIATGITTLSNVEVRGFDSTWVNTSTLVVGEAGRGGLQVTDGGHVLSNSGSIGQAATSFGNVAVVGFDSRWTNATQIRVGVAGEGILSVSGSGEVVSTSGTIASLEGADGVAVVSGQGSSWSIAQALVVGAGGRGGLTVDSGGFASSASITIGLGETAEGTATVSGFASMLSTGTLTVGDKGLGRLYVDGGGRVESQDVQLATDVGRGIAVVSGAGSVWSVAAGFEMGTDEADAAGGELIVGRGTALEVGGDLSIGRLSEFDLSGRVEVGMGTTVGDGAVLRVQGGSLTSESFQVEMGGHLRMNQGELHLEGAWNNAGEVYFSGAILPELSALSWENDGLIVGGARISSSIVNDATGVWRLGTNERIVGTGTANVNRGNVNMSNGGMEFSGSFENTADGEVSGRGALRAAGGHTNRGDMLFSGGQTDVQGEFLNTGSTALVLSTGGGTVTFYDDVTNNSSAEIRVSEGSHVVFLASFNGGTTGPGTAIVEGVLSPGNSPASVTFEGDLKLTEESTTILELGGTVPDDEHDQILGEKMIELGGDLELVTIDDYEGPGRGEVASYLLVSALGELRGLYSSINYNGAPVRLPVGGGVLQSHLGEGLFRTVAYSDHDLSLTDYLAIPGDADGNGDVGFSDFQRLSVAFGGAGTWTEGDFDDDGQVRFSDFQILNSFFGESVNGAAVAVVPEPTAWGWLGVVFAGLISRKRRCARRAG